MFSKTNTNSKSSYPKQQYGGINSGVQRYYQSFQIKMNISTSKSVCPSVDYSISSGLITLKGFFQVRNHKEYQNVVIISFVHLEKINIFCFMHNGVAQKLSLPRPLEN